VGAAGWFYDWLAEVREVAEQSSGLYFGQGVAGVR